MKLSQDVTDFLNENEHPLRPLINELRKVILSSDDSLQEYVKWNGPSYGVGEQDLFTIKIFPPKQIQLVLHQGVKTKPSTKGNIIKDETGLIDWKDVNRGLISFTTLDQLELDRKDLQQILRNWKAVTLSRGD